jgi:hypothetical protein
MKKKSSSWVFRSLLVVPPILLGLQIYRKWALTWGATKDEVRRSLPGDEVVPNASFNATRAMTIKARPEDIWPWIKQIGYGKAGFYSYDLLDNDGVPSSDRIIPEFQDLKAGDLIPMTKDIDATVAALEPNQSMLMIFPMSSQEDGKWTWYWSLTREGDRRTRLITRVRVSPNNIGYKILLDFGEIIMMRKCMLGIKNRAELTN